MREPPHHHDRRSAWINRLHTLTNYCLTVTNFAPHGALYCLMNFKTRIKAGSVSNLTDARYFAALEVDWIGFNFERGHADFIDPVQAKAMIEWLEGPRFVGEFGSHTAEEVAMAIQNLDLDEIQLSPITDAAIGNGQPVPVLREIVVDRDTTELDLSEYVARAGSNVEAFVLDFSRNGIAWSALRDDTLRIPMHFLQTFCNRQRVIVDLPILPQEVDEMLELLMPYGLQVKGGAEEKVGYKSYEELDDLFEVLQVVRD